MPSCYKWGTRVWLGVGETLIHLMSALKMLREEEEGQGAFLMHRLTADVLVKKGAGRSG